MLIALNWGGLRVKKGIIMEDTSTKERLLHEAKYNGVGNSDRGLNIQLYSGKPFFPCDPREDEIDIVDIAHALSLICRFGGHCKQPYSVAQHSVLMSNFVDKENAFYALMHDATEAYVGDLVRPIKYMLPEFIELENNIWKVISKKYGLPEKMPEDVKNHDTRICFTEKRDILNPSNGVSWGYEMKPHEYEIVPWGWEESKNKFLERFDELYK